MTQIRNLSLIAALIGALLGYLFGPWIGISGGVIILLALVYFFILPELKKQSQVENIDNKPIGYAGSANHFMNGEAMGGQLFLFDDRLEFKSHRLNIQEHTKVIDLKNIKEVNFYNSLGIVPNGLAIITTDGKREKFIVTKRQTWKQEIERAISFRVQ
jgi:hypothetical protein